MKYYKILVNGKSCHGGDLEWPLPKGGKKGKWVTFKGKLIPCQHGLHLATKPYAWYKWGCDCYEAEAGGKIIECDGYKIVCSKARLIRKVPHPKWWRDVQAFVAELPKIKWFSQHKKPLKKWKLFTAHTLAAAGDAAWGAARGAARDAAWGAAGDAAGDAAWGAARGAARDAARDAARGAARDAAWGAAWGAAWDAARDAAWGAAWDAELYAQCLVCSYLRLAKKHMAHAKARMEVWKRGWRLLCDVDGVLYVYGVDKKEANNE